MEKNIEIINLKYMNLYQKNILLEIFHQFYPVHLVTWFIQLPVNLKNSLLSQYLSALYRLGIQATAFIETVIKIKKTF